MGFVNLQVVRPRGKRTSSENGQKKHTVPIELRVKVIIIAIIVIHFLTFTIQMIISHRNGGVLKTEDRRTDHESQLIPLRGAGSMSRLGVPTLEVGDSGTHTCPATEKGATKRLTIPNSKIRSLSVVNPSS